MSAFSFEWPSEETRAARHSNIMQRLAHLRERGELCDVNLVPTDADGTEYQEALYIERLTIAAHKPVLAVSSPYFDAMFDAQTGMQETTANRVHIQMSREVLLAIVSFFYTGLLTTGGDLIWDLVDAASYFHLNELKEQCGRFLSSSLTVENCLEMACLGDKYSLTTLTEAGWKHARDNFRRLSKTPAFLDLTVDMVVQLISADSLSVHREEFVYSAILRWVRSDATTRKQHLSSSDRRLRLLSLVRLSLMRNAYLLDTVSEEPLIDEDAACRRMVRNAVKDSVLGSSSVSARPSYHSAYRLPWSMSGHRWTSLPRMTVKRRWHSAASLEGRIYAAGGNDGTNTLSSMEMIDTNASQPAWLSARALPHSLHAHGLTAFGNSMYAVGGIGYLRNVLIYDAGSDAWTDGPMMNDGRCDCATSLDSSLFAAGSANLAQKSDTAEMWDTRTADWSRLPPMLVARTRPQLAALNGQVFVLGDSNGGNNEMECYDLRAGKWRMDAAVNMTCGFRVAVCGRSLVMCGGAMTDDNDWTFVDTVNVYRDGEWTEAAPLAYRSNGAVCAVHETVFSVGGYCGMNEVCDSVDGLAMGLEEEEQEEGEKEEGEEDTA